MLINLDTCQSNSVPIWCDSLSSTTCLCNAGIRSTESNPCLGKYLARLVTYITSTPTFTRRGF